MFKLKNSIGLRLLRYVFGCYLVVAIIVTVAQLYFEYQDVKSSVFDQLYDLEHTFRESLVASLWSFDMQQLEVTLFGMKKIEAVAGVKIESDKNALLASLGTFRSKNSEIISNAKTEREGITQVTLQSDDGNHEITLFEYRFPLAFEEEAGKPPTLLGYGHIYADKDTIIEHVKYSFVLIIINSVIKTVALWVFFLLFVNRVIGRPLNDLAHAASALNPQKLETLTSSKNLDRVLQARRDDELFQVADNFNQMREAILEKINIIETQNNTLEKRVAARTESLTEANKELRYLALHDTLTHLPNRNLFQDRLEQMLKQAERNRTRFAVASIDLREFKSVNDNYGHQIGDLLLAEVAKRMTSVLRSSDTLARIGGDEFSALFPVVDADDAEMISRNLLKSLYDPVIFEGFDNVSILANADIGTSLYPDHGEDSETLIKNADMAMYQAKHSGIRYAGYSREVDSVIRRQLKLSQDIDSAIEKEQLFLLYQPIIEIKTGQISKVEALIRWQHPELGLISPMEFIPIAEQNGSILAITEWVLNTACEECKDYCYAETPISVSVNISGRIFNQTKLPPLLSEVCLNSGVAEDRINLEITETTAMDKPARAIELIDQLNQQGFTVSMDDFGTGYSSFSFLTMLPVSELKLDKSFLMNDSENTSKVIKAMIELSHSLNLKVVAEGVEDESILQMLETMNCDFAQGYYFAKPLSLDQLDEMLGSRSSLAS